MWDKWRQRETARAGRHQRVLCFCISASRADERATSPVRRGSSVGKSFVGTTRLAHVGAAGAAVAHKARARASTRTTELGAFTGVGCVMKLRRGQELVAIV